MIGTVRTSPVARRRKLVFADRMSSISAMAAGVAHEINNHSPP
jgi:C4-dicarboxylate-specific signal transduction histidine kinase